MRLQPTSPDVNNIEDHPVLSFIHPSLHEESNLEPTTPIPDEILPESDEEEFTIVVGGSKRGGDILVSRGYSYNKDGKVNKKGDQRWRCTVRNKSVNCRASINQHGETFKIGPHPHRCSPKDCALPAANIKAYVRQQGKERPFASGSTLAKEAVHRHLPADAPLSSMPKMSSIVRTTNRLRQARRPKQPKDLNFTWVTEKLPDNFVQHDLPAM